MVKNMVEHHTEIGEVEKVNKLYEVIGPLLRDGEGEADEGAGDDDDFAEEQRYVGRVVPPLTLLRTRSHNFAHARCRRIHKILERVALNKSKISV